VLCYSNGYRNGRDKKYKTKRLQTLNKKAWLDVLTNYALLEDTDFFDFVLVKAYIGDFITFIVILFSILFLNFCIQIL